MTISHSVFYINQIFSFIESISEEKPEEKLRAAFQKEKKKHFRSVSRANEQHKETINNETGNELQKGEEQIDLNDDS